MPSGVLPKSAASAGFLKSHPHPSASRQVQHSSRISQAAEDAIRSFDKEPTPVSKLQVQESLLIRL